MTDLNSIRARLGSLSPAALEKLPKAVQTLVQKDIPELLARIEELNGTICNTPEHDRTGNGKVSN